jgi:hypothetical protein
VAADLLTAHERHLALVVALSDEIVLFACSKIFHETLFQELSGHLLGIADEGLISVFIAPIQRVVEFDPANIDHWISVFGGGKRWCLETQANARPVRMSVGFAALLWLARLSGFQCSLKPGFGTTFLFAVVRIISLTRFTLTAFSVFTETVVRIATGLTVDVALFTTGLTLDVAHFTARLTLDVALFATGLTLTLDVALFTARLFTAGFFTAGTVLGTVGRRVSGFVADSAVLIQERRADDFSIGSGLVLDEVACVFRSGTACIVTNFAVGAVISVVGGGGSISGRRHCIRLFLMEALLVSDLGKNISIFSQTHRIRHIILFFKVHSK